MPRSSAARRFAGRFLDDARRRRLVQWRQRLRHPLVTVRAGDAEDLDALARYYGTDKSSAGHGYARHYAHHFGPRRDAVESLLEIGVGGITSTFGYETAEGGHSLQMWSRYFPRASILGIDIHPKDVSGARIHFEQGSQSDEPFLRSLANKYGPFDIVIDDGSHVGRDVIASMGVLWDAVRPGGYYVIEDLQTAYHPDWEGGPPGTPGTAADLIKKRVDETLRREQDPFEPSVAAMHIYAEIAFFEKA
jgi:hypothetical protein